MEFSETTKKLCTAYKFTPQDIALCYALAAGAHPVDTFKVTHKISDHCTSEHVTKLFNDWKVNHPGAAVLINRVKLQRSPRPTKEEIKQVEQNTIEEERKGKESNSELKTRAGIIDALINNVQKVSGRDAVSGLQTLAKLQGLDKPEEKEGDDKRVFYLPYVSNCRNCRLMQLFRAMPAGDPEK